jgi:Protein of unknown function (DUF4238)
MTDLPPGTRPIVPSFLLGGFADAAGQLMAERRDRTRRRLVPVPTVQRELGTYALSHERAGAATLGRLLEDAEARAAESVRRMTAGAFPPPPPDRASLAMVVAVQILLGRRHRAAAAQAAEVGGQIIVASLEARETEAESDDEPGSAEPGPAGSSAPPEQGPEDAGRDAGAGPAEVVLSGERDRASASLAPALPLAGQIMGRIWQLVRFPEPVLLTSDTPVVLWMPSATAKPYQVGLGAADEIRLPLDPRHALIVARRARAGEIVRDLGERHARALNRTIAESAAEWMYYHPESDPLEGVELPSADAG